MIQHKRFNQAIKGILFVSFCLSYIFSPKPILIIFFGSLFFFKLFFNVDVDKVTVTFRLKCICIPILLFRCQCGWEEADHDHIHRNVTSKIWDPDDVTLKDTNAHGEIEFRGAGKVTRAKVTIKLSLVSKGCFECFLKLTR